MTVSSPSPMSPAWGTDILAQKPIQETPCSSSVTKKGCNQKWGCKNIRHCCCSPGCQVNINSSAVAAALSRTQNCSLCFRPVVQSKWLHSLLVCKPALRNTCARYGSPHVLNLNTGSFLALHLKSCQCLSNSSFKFHFYSWTALQHKSFISIQNSTYNATHTNKHNRYLGNK